MARPVRTGSTWTASRLAIRARYAAYIDSPTWAARRRRWFADERKAGRRPACVVCGAGERLELHHLTYERLGSERHDDLAALCSADHAALHAIWDAAQAYRALGRAVGSRAIIGSLRRSRGR